MPAPTSSAARAERPAAERVGDGDRDLGQAALDRRGGTRRGGGRPAQAAAAGPGGGEERRRARAENEQPADEQRRRPEHRQPAPLGLGRRVTLAAGATQRLDRLGEPAARDRASRATASRAATAAEPARGRGERDADRPGARHRRRQSSRTPTPRGGRARPRATSATRRAPSATAGHVDDEVDPARELLADRLVRQADAGHQRQRLEPPQGVLGRVRVHGRERAVVAGVERGQQVERLGPRTSPITIRSGRIRSALRSRSRIVTSPAALDRCRPALEPDHVRLAQAELGRVLDRDHPLAGPMQAESALSRVVLPDPVPPETRMLRRARTASASRSRSSARQGARRRPARRGPGARAAKRRIDSAGPSTASGGITTLTREPSASRASAIGLSSSTRRPSGARIRSIASRSARSDSKRTSAALDPAAALDVDRRRGR